jgi:hypothetical protein
MWKRIVAVKENRAKIDSLDTVPLFDAEVDDVLKRHHRSTVDDHVESFPSVERSLNGRLYLGLLGYIGFREDCLTTGFGDGIHSFRAMLLIEVNDNHAAAFPSESFTRGATDAGTSAGNKTDLILKSHSVDGMRFRCFRYGLG